MIYPIKIEKLVVYESEFYTTNISEIENFMTKHGTKYFEMRMKNGYKLILEDKL